MGNLAEERSSSKQAVISPLSLLLAADRITDAFVSVDSNFCFVYINDTAARVFQLDTDQVIGTDFRASESSASRLTFLPVYEDAMQSQQPMVFSAYYPTIDAWFENRIFPAKNGLSILFTDISAQKRKEREVWAEADRISYLLTHDRLTGLCNRVFYEEEKDRLEASGVYPVSLIVGDINGLKRVNSKLGTTVGNDLLKTTAQIFQSSCRSTDLVSRTGGDEFTIMLAGSGAKAAESIIRRIDAAVAAYNGSVDSDLLRISLSLGYATKTHSGISIEEVERMADDQMCGSKLLEQRSMHSTVVASIKSTMVAKSRETEEHAERLSSLTRKLGEALGLSPAELNELELFSVLHDIGKIAISDKILNKPGDLTADEWRQMKKHSEIGCEIAKASPELNPIAGYILTHHENWDGSGYPFGISGEEIPLASRILAIADAYDAMTQDRVYRTAMDHLVAVSEIRKDRGVRFDPAVVDVFLELIGE